MSIFGSIMSKIFHAGSATAATPDQVVETASQTPARRPHRRPGGVTDPSPTRNPIRATFQCLA